MRTVDTGWRNLWRCLSWPGWSWSLLPPTKVRLASGLDLDNWRFQWRRHRLETGCRRTGRGGGGVRRARGVRAVPV